MAERALPAFGRYVKMLRERRGLSLEDAVALTRVYPSPLSKGYVSRVEHGLTRVGFEKVIAIARAYEVPVDVLAERLWLDLELDTTNPPDTSGFGLLELNERGIAASSQGRPWAVYAYLRDAMTMALDHPVESRFRDRNEQLAYCATNLGSAGMRLGAFRYARSEMEEARTLLSKESVYQVLVSTQLSSLCRRVGDLAAARSFADEAIAHASANEQTRYLGFALVSRGMVAHAEHEFDAAADCYQRAITVFRSLGLGSEHANALLNVAQAFFDLGRTSAAKRAVASAEKLAVRDDVEHVRVRGRILLGEIEERGGHVAAAMTLWREAADIAKQIRDRTLLFKADFLLFRRAVADDNIELARAVARRLSRISPWVLQDIPELAEFRAMSQKRDYLRRQRPRVAD